MSPKHLAVAVLLAACTFVTHASAQKNELSGLIGRTFISDQGIKGGTFFDNNIHFGKGLTFEANYARRVLRTRDCLGLPRGARRHQLGRRLGFRRFANTQEF